MATPALFELTSFPLCPRIGAATPLPRPTSYKWRVFGSLSASVYTIMLDARGANPTKFTVPTSFAGRERNRGRKGRGYAEARDRTGGEERRRLKMRERRGSSVAIVMSPMLLPLLLLVVAPFDAVATVRLETVAVCDASGVAEVGSPTSCSCRPRSSSRSRKCNGPDDVSRPRILAIDSCEIGESRIALKVRREFAHSERYHC